MKKIQTTLIIIHKHPHILLGMKKRGFGMGKWNGFGGKIQDGEEIAESAKRELFEEAGISVKDIENVGILDFIFPDGETVETHIFRACEFFGELCESEEMAPKWFHIDEIPFQEMWSDDKHWMPLFLRGKKFRGKFTFDENNNVTDYELNKVLPDGVSEKI